MKYKLQYDQFAGDTVDNMSYSNIMELLSSDFIMDSDNISKSDIRRLDAEMLRIHRLTRFENNL